MSKYNSDFMAAERTIQIPNLYAIYLNKSGNQTEQNSYLINHICAEEDFVLDFVQNLNMLHDKRFGKNGSFYYAKPAQFKYYQIE